MIENYDINQELMNAIRGITDCIVADHRLTQDLVFHFMKSFVADTASFLDEIKSESYESMRSLLYEVWQYREFEDLSPEQAFLYGQLYGCVKLCDYREENHHETVWINSLVSKYSDSKLFSIVKEHPGIRHKDLAQKMNITPGRLSQLMDDEDMNELLSSRLLGREKYYFLTLKGELLQQKLEAQKRETESVDDEVADIFVPDYNRNKVLKTLIEIRVEELLRNASKWTPTQHIEDWTLSNDTKYPKLNNDLRAETSKGEGKECLTAENYYHVQMTNPSRIGSPVFLAR